MKNSLLLSAGVCLLGLAVSSTAFAQKSQGPKAKLMAKYDLNHNGVIDGDEIAAVRKDFAAEPAGDLKRFDTDKNGKLSDAEIAEMKPPGAKSSDTKDAKKKGGSKKSDGTTEETKTSVPAPATDATKEKSTP
jgi:hypothetical protein